VEKAERVEDVNLGKVEGIWEKGLPVLSNVQKVLRQLSLRRSAFRIGDTAATSQPKEEGEGRGE